METNLSPTVLVSAALMVGAGLYVIQRSRFFVPVLIARVPFLRRNPTLARYLFLAGVSLAVLMAGVGCRLLYQGIVLRM